MTILVVAEHDNASLKGATLNTISAAAKLGGDVVVLVAGSGAAGAVEVFEAAFAHEQKVTSQIHDIYELALEQKDYQAQVLLQWFISEQLEEEKLTGGMVDRLRMVEGSRSALLILDAELGSRQGDGGAH